MLKLFAADRILTNGKIVTVDARNTIVEAIAIKDGRFLATGTNTEIMDLASGDTEVLNLEGKTVLPGLIDSHTHPVLQAAHLIAINCRQPSVKAIADIKEMVRVRALELGPGKWVRAVNFNDSKLSEKRHITRWELDEVAPDNPVYILADTTHRCVVNSRTLELAGINKETVNPPGGDIERNEAGEATGLLHENAVDLVSEIIPEFDLEELRPGYRKALNQFSKWGITSTHDAYARRVGVRAFQQLLNEGVEQVRISLMVPMSQLEALVNIGLESGFGNDWHKIMTLKIFADGSGPGGTAAVYEPQNRGPKGLGLWMTDPETIEATVIKAHESGIRCAVHCIGDRGVDVVLDCIEKAQEKKPIPDMRHRLEHATLVTPKQLKRIKVLKVVPASTIGAVYYLGEQIAENFGPERSRWIYPHKTMIEMGIIAGGNSDFPVVATNPFAQIYTVVTRKTESGETVAPEEAVDIMEAIRIYTWNGAYLSKDEDKLGSIEPCKLADLIVLDRDIISLPPEKLLETNVLMTIANGKTVYQS